MSQTFTTIAEGTGLRQTQTELVSNYAALRSGFSGTSIPTMVAGQVSVVKFTVAHGQLTDPDNGDAQAITLGTIPANSVVLYRRIKTSIAFSGGSIATLGIEVGIGTNADQFLTSFDGLAAVSATNFAESTTAATPTTAAFDVVATFTPDAGHNLAALDAGSVDIWVYFMVLP
jgi:hypothetical protein